MNLQKLVRTVKDCLLPKDINCVDFERYSSYKTTHHSCTTNKEWDLRSPGKLRSIY